MPAGFHGPCSEVSSVSTTTSQTANNVLTPEAQGSTCTSIWLIHWGPMSVTAYSPRAQKAGFRQEDMGKTPVYDSNSNPYYAWQTPLQMGRRPCSERLAVCGQDQRTSDVSTLSGRHAPDLINLMIRAIHRLPLSRPGWKRADVRRSASHSRAGGLLLQPRDFHLVRHQAVNKTQRAASDGGIRRKARDQVSGHSDQDLRPDC